MRSLAKHKYIKSQISTSFVCIRKMVTLYFAHEFSISPYYSRGLIMHTRYFMGHGEGFCSLKSQSSGRWRPPRRAPEGHVRPQQRGPSPISQMKK